MNCITLLYKNLSKWGYFHAYINVCIGKYTECVYPKYNNNKKKHLFNYIRDVAMCVHLYFDNDKTLTINGNIKSINNSLFCLKCKSLRNQHLYEFIIKKSSYTFIRRIYIYSKVYTPCTHTSYYL